jgi:glycogen operon protein
VLSNVKLIAVPWDLGEGGYQVGNFPAGWAEWNGKYRDCVRRFWKGEGGTAAELATRIAGSSDLYEAGGRRPSASINFITAHDGFTLNDLVSYNDKHNEANGEENRDGENNNNSWNCGAEGPDASAEVQALRARQKKNFIATLLLSQGVPMISHGDEMGRTQRGNNNSYCQDNELSWVNWEMGPSQSEQLEFVRAVIRLWCKNPVFHRRHFFQGRPIRGKDIKEIQWIDPSGGEMTDESWQGQVSAMGISLSGQAINEVDDKGKRISGDSFLLLLNAGANQVDFKLAPPPENFVWKKVFDTWDFKNPGEAKLRGGENYGLHDRSFVVLKAEKSG